MMLSRRRRSHPELADEISVEATLASIRSLAKSIQQQADRLHTTGSDEYDDETGPPSHDEVDTDG